MDSGGSKYSLNEMLIDFSARADRITRKLGGITEKEWDNVSVDGFIKKLDSWGESRLMSIDTSSPTLPETIEVVTETTDKPEPAGDRLLQRYQDELEMRDTVITRQSGEVSDLRSQLSFQQNTIQNLQQMLLDIQWKLNRLDSIEKDSQAGLSSMNEPEQKPSEPVITSHPPVHASPADFPFYREARPIISEEYTPAPVPPRGTGMENFNGFNISSQGSHESALVPVYKNPEEILSRPVNTGNPDDGCPEKSESPATVQDILKSGGGAKLYDI